MNVEAIAKEEIDAWFTEWQELESKIHIAHDTRNGEAKGLMEAAIVLFDHLVEEGGDEVLPINGIERMAFIKAKPGQYACYRQLDELFKETKKRAARLRLQATKNNSNG
ncbi:YpoC family protein [Lysinibacillus sp. NPDC047702]|uniref:YpoC family protein n=1 Tax=unclassified Lysinibacillus TaxID=2636778 RepID=UPI003CFEEA4A